MNTTSIDERALFEDDEVTGNGMTDEELKIESLKIATNIAKLMSNVTPDDIVNIAETVCNFIKNGDSEADFEDTEEDFVSDEDEDEDTSEETSEETSDKDEKKSEDEEENFEV